MTPLEVAQKELAAGVRESSGANDGVPARRYNDGEEKPWCASFLRYCYHSAGLGLPGKWYLLPSVAYLESQLEAAGARIVEPIPGAVVTFKTRIGSDRGPGRHCGIIEKVSRSTITTIEGNVQNRVMRRVHGRAHADITGYFFWPTRRAHG